MDIQQVINHIEQTAPLGHAASWDKSGIQVAGTRTKADKLAAALDPTPQAVRAALEWGADFLLTHHPLSMEPRFLDRLDDYHQVASLLLGAGVWLYSAHTSLDAQPRGPAGWLARDLGLTGLATLEPSGSGASDQSSPVPGFGLAGTLPEPLDWTAFARRLAGAVQRDYWVVSGPEPGTVERIALCTGSGASLIHAAADAGAQVFVTGDVKYHPALSTPIRVVDVGHFALEEEMMRRFAADLARDEALSGLDIRFFPGSDPHRLHLAQANAEQAAAGGLHKDMSS